MAITQKLRPKIMARTPPCENVVTTPLGQHDCETSFTNE